MSSSPDIAPDPTADVVDPASVPARVLTRGDRIPAIGMGTFGSDRYGAEEVAAAVRGALEAGYRLVDCAAVYGNEAEIGPVLADARDASARATSCSCCRSCGTTPTAPEASQVGPPDADRSRARPPRRLLRALALPQPPPAGRGPRRPRPARPAVPPRRFMETWQAMESLVDQGLVRHLGTSNVTVPKLG